MEEYGLSLHKQKAILEKFFASTTYPEPYWILRRVPQIDSHEALGQRVPERISQNDPIIWVSQDTSAFEVMGRRLKNLGGNLGTGF